MTYTILGELRSVCVPKCAAGRFHYFDPKTMHDLTDDQQRCESAHDGGCREGFVQIGEHICAKMTCADY